jgi:hypothetical protein
MHCIETDTPPALMDRDKLIRTDAAWREAAERFVQVKAEAESLAERLEAAKAALLGLAVHPSELGFGVSVTRFWKSGSVDYKRVPELVGIDLDHYRQKGRFETRVSVGK